jgi:hypothetical protein
MKITYLISIIFFAAVLLLTSYTDSKPETPKALTSQERQEIELAINIIKDIMVKIDSTNYIRYESKIYSN